MMNKQRKRSMRNVKKIIEAERIFEEVTWPSFELNSPRWAEIKLKLERKLKRTLLPYEELKFMYRYAQMVELGL
jgi:hypothetical protein